MKRNSYPRLEFGYNWNHKLNCRSFSTIRLHNPEKYSPGRRFEIHTKMHLYDPETRKKRYEPEYMGIAQVVQVLPFHLTNLTEGMAWIDTGYNAAATKQIIRRMYSKRVPDVDKAVFAWVLLVYCQYLDPKANDPNDYMTE